MHEDIDAGRRGVPESEVCIDAHCLAGKGSSSGYGYDPRLVNIRKSGLSRVGFQHGGLMTI